MRRVRLVIVALALALPGAVPAWQAWNFHDVYPVQKGVWEVVKRPRSAAWDFWCAIGDFALAELRVGATQRIYLWRGLGPSVTRSGYKAVQFSLTPPAGADTTPGLTLSVNRVGDNLTAAAARQYCFGMADPGDFWLRP